MATLADHLVRFGTHVNQSDSTLGMAVLQYEYDSMEEWGHYCNNVVG